MYVCAWGEVYIIQQNTGRSHIRSPRRKEVAGENTTFDELSSWVSGTVSISTSLSSLSVSESESESLGATRSCDFSLFAVGIDFDCERSPRVLVFEGTSDVGRASAECRTLDEVELGRGFEVLEETELAMGFEDRGADFDDFDAEALLLILSSSKRRNRRFGLFWRDDAVGSSRTGGSNILCDDFFLLCRPLTEPVDTREFPELRLLELFMSPKGSSHESPCGTGKPPRVRALPKAFSQPFAGFFAARSLLEKLAKKESCESSSRRENELVVV